MAENLMQLFWDLSSSDDSKKMTSANKMITTLSDSLTSGCYKDCSELQYCVNRLVKGLASNRKGVRHGYYITLTEMLKMFPIPISDVFKLIKNYLERVGNAKAQEERGIYFGRVFAYLAVVESGRLKDPDDIKHVCKAIMKIYAKKSFLQEFCAVTIGRLIGGVNDDLIYQSVLAHLGLECGWGKCSPGKLYLLLTLLERGHSDDRLLEFLSLNWGCTDLFTQQTLAALSEILMASSHSHPRVHVIWPLIINRVRGGPLWGSFWNTVINDSLLVSSHERKYLCYKLIEELILPSLKLGEVNMIFSPRLIQQLENNGSTKHHLLHDAAKHFLDYFPSVVVDGTADSGSALALAMQLVRYQTTNVFRGAIRKLLCNISVEDVAKYIDFLVNELVNELGGAKKHQWMDREISMLLKVIDVSLKRRRAWLITLAQFLLLHSHFFIRKPIPSLNVQNVFEPASGDASYMEKLAHVLTLLSDLKCVRGDSYNQVSCDLWPVSLVIYIENLLKQDGCVQIVTEVNMEVWNKSIGIILELKEKESKDDVDCAFMYLLSVCLLDMLNNREKPIDTIEEIVTCYQKRVSHLKKTPRRKHSAALLSPSWLPVLIDLLLGLLSNHNQFWRNVSERVFLWLKASLTHEAIEVIVKAIEPQKIEEIMKREGEDDSISEEQDKQNDVSSDGDEDVSGDNGDDDSEESESGESDNLFHHDVGAEFRADVRNALGDLAAVDSDQESVTSLDEQEMEALDSALSAVFQKQKEKSIAKKQSKTDKVAVMHFKMRALEFVEIYIRHQSANPLMLEFLNPLLALVTKYNSHKSYSPLSERSRSLLDKMCKVKSYPREGIDVDELHLILKEMITKKLYSVMFLKYIPAQRLTPVITQCAMFLLRVLKGTHKPPAISPLATRSSRKRRHLEKETEEKQKPTEFGSLMVDDVVEWCSSALRDMVTDKNCNVQVGFFITLSDRQPEIAWKLLPTLASSLKDTGNHYRKIQGYNALRVILGKYRSLSDESVVSLLLPVSADLLSTMSQELLNLSISNCKIAHYWPLIEAYSDTVLTVQSYEKLRDSLDDKLLSEVLRHLSTFNDRKLEDIITSLGVSNMECSDDDAEPSGKRKI